MALSCVDVARDDLDTPETCTKDCPGAFFEEGHSDAQVRIRKKKGEGAEVKEIWLNYREVLKGDNVGYKSQLSFLILSPSPPLMRWGWAIYILGICTQGLSGHFSECKPIYRFTPILTLLVLILNICLILDLVLSTCQYPICG